jgi:hypothetical protein
MSIEVAASTPSSSCHGSSDSNSIPLTLAGYDLLDKFGESATGEQAPGALNIVETSEGVGTFSIGLVDDFFNLVLAMKDGNNTSPKILYFALGPGILGGNWTIEEWVNGAFNKYKGFSSAVLFGQACPDGGCPDDANSPVPLPGAVWLFGSALAGLGFLGMRRRRKRSTLDFSQT